MYCPNLTIQDTDNVFAVIKSLPNLEHLGLYTIELSKHLPFKFKSLNELVNLKTLEVPFIITSSKPLIPKTL